MANPYWTPFALSALLLLISLVGLSAAGNCTLGASFQMTSSSQGLIVSNSGANVTISSAIEGRIQPTSVNITIRLAEVDERSRLERKNDRCNCPGGFKDPSTLVDDDNEPYAPILQRHTIDDFDCLTQFEDEVRNGVKITRIRTEFWLSTNHSWHMTLLYDLANDTLIEFPNNDTTHTAGEIYSFRWSPDRLKITAHINNYPFIGPSTPAVNSSFVSLHFLMSFTIRRGIGQMLDGNSSKLDFATLDEPTQSLFYEFEKAYLMDGVPKRNLKGRDAHNVLDLSFLPPNTVVPTDLWASVPICDITGGHFQSVIYDPQLSSLFKLKPAEPSATPSNTPLAKSNRVTIIVASTVVGSVVIALAAFVLAAWNVPKLRAKVIPSTVKMPQQARVAKTTEPQSRPSTKPVQESQPKEASKEASKGRTWTSASKPANE